MANKPLKEESSKDKKKTTKKSSALAAAAKGRSAVDHVMADSTRAVRGTNRLSNTGPTTTYENEE